MVTVEPQVRWDDPTDADLSWNRDVMHAPEAVKPLTGWMFGTCVGHGLAHTFDEYAFPVTAPRFKVFNAYLYGSAPVPRYPLDEMETRAQEAQAKVGAVLPRIMALWNDTYLPEIKELLDEVDTTEIRAAQPERLTEIWRRVLEVGERLFEIHFLILIPSMLAVSEFDELYRGIFPDDDAYGSWRLLQGHMNLTVETGFALWELSREARDVPDVLSALSSRTPLAKLEGTEAGRAFLVKLRAYLDEYGQRGDKWDVSFPSWIEDPTPVISNLKEYVKQDTHPAGDLQAAAAQRDRHVAEVRERLNDHPMAGPFEFLLKAASEGIVITEDHGFWIDFRGGHRFRMAALAFGRRFVDEGAIETVDDIFFFRPPDVAETIATLGTVDRRGLVEINRAEWAAAAASRPPDALGVPPAEGGEEDPVSRALRKFFGEPPAPSPAAEIRGNPGSPGVAVGTARVLSSITEVDRLEPDDILVTESTAPPWTPLFAIAGAVVTDTGGVMSHCAVVAREYAIPAVVGCGDATARIADGQTIEVNGNDGVVRVVS